LRLRVLLDPAERAAIRANVFLTDELTASLEGWIDRHYREQLGFPDLSDPALLREGREALDELTRLLGLGSVYDFQRDPTTSH
jgi:succinylarginine dihydrolase